MNKTSIQNAFLFSLLISVISGCAIFDGANKPEPITPAQAVARADALLEEGLYADAIIATTEIYRTDPLTVGLSELQAKIMAKLAELRAQSASTRQKSSDAIAMADLDLQGILPDTYRQRRHVVGETKPIHSLENEMQKVLKNPITIHLDDVDLSAVVAEIARSGGVNIVADAMLGMDDDGEPKTISIHVRSTPLAEVLEYIGRNLGVTFAVGDNIIWVTEQVEESKGPPLVTRIYRLRRGLTNDELGGISEKTSNSPASKNDSSSGASAASGTIAIIEAIERFVPEVEGADIFFDKKSHAILVKNTKANMALIEDIVEVLDVTPPQVLIEARFISTGVTDIRELGIDWFLNSDWVTSKKHGDRTRTRVSGGLETGSAAAFSPFANQAQGLNLTYEGVLTDPMFAAVIHALDVSGNSRTLSVPRVTTMNNREARLRIGEDFRFFEDYDIEEIRTGTTESGNETYESRLVPTGTPTLEELGIELRVVPSVGADLAAINLKLAPEISEFVRWEYYETAADTDDYDDDDDDEDYSETTALSMLKLPIFRRSQVETELSVRSGETVIMGGLVTSSRVKSVAGIPFISKLPFIGRFFRHDVWENTSQNLLIFVTATLIADTGEELIPLATFEPEPPSTKVELGK